MGRRSLANHRPKNRNLTGPSNTDTRMKNPAARPRGPLEPPVICHKEIGLGIIGGGLGACIVLDLVSNPADPTRKLVTFESKPLNPDYPFGFAFTAHAITDLAPILFVSNNGMTVLSIYDVLPNVKWNEIVYSDGLGGSFSLFIRLNL